MSIYRLSARSIDGLLVGPDSATAAQLLRSPEGFRTAVDRLLGECAILPELLPVGRTEITPSSFLEERSSRHFVDVRLGQMSATYWMAPRRDDQQLDEYLVTPAGIEMRPLPGAFSVNIPREEPLVPILGVDEMGGIRLHEVIFYLPRTSD